MMNLKNNPKVKEAVSFLSENKGIIIATVGVAIDITVLVLRIRKNIKRKAE